MRRRTLLTIILLAGFGLLLFWRVLLGGEVFFWHDVTVAYMPLRKLAQDAIREGHLPLWTQQFGCGFPLLAEGQAATFYPLHIIAYLGMPYYHTYSLMVALHCMMGAIFAALLGRKLGLGWMAAAFAGLVYGFSGYFVTKVLFITVLESGAWLPLILYLMISGLKSGKKRYFIGGAVALCLSILGGHPQIVFYEILAAIAFLVAYLIGQRKPTFTSRLRRSLLAGFIVLALGVGLAAIQLAPTAALAGFADRHSQVSPAHLRSLGMSAHNLAYYIHPTIFGSYAENNYFGHDHYYEVCGYAGGLTLLLALLAIIGRQPAPRYSWYFVFLVFFGLFMALAKYNPLYEALPYVPGFNFFRAPGRYLLLTTLGLALLAGGGVQALSTSRLQARRLSLICLAVLVLAGGTMLGFRLAHSSVVGVLSKLTAEVSPDSGLATDSAQEKAEAKYRFFVERLSLTNPNWQAFVIGTALVGLAALLLALGLTEYPTVAIVCLLVLGWQLLAFGLPYNATAPAIFYTDSPTTAQIIHTDQDPGRQYTDPRLYYINFASPGYEGWLEGNVQPYFEAREILHANSAVLYDIVAIEGYRYALLPKRQYEVFEKYIADGLAGKSGGAARPLQLLRMLNVEYFVGLPELESPEIEPIYAQPQFTMYRIRDPMPWAWVAQYIKHCTSAGQAQEIILSPQFRPERVTVVEGADRQFALFKFGEVRVEATGEPWGMSMQISIPNLQAPRITKAPETKALLVLSMAYNPNLVARVDGQPIPIYRTDYVLCGVPVPQGEHTVTVRYESRSLQWGLLISLISVLIMLILLAAMGRQKRKWEAADGP